jgi:hypothetical protein
MVMYKNKYILKKNNEKFKNRGRTLSKEFIDNENSEVEEILFDDDDNDDNINRNINDNNISNNDKFVEYMEMLNYPHNFVEYPSYEVIEIIKDTQGRKLSLGKTFLLGEERLEEQQNKERVRIDEIKKSIDDGNKNNRNNDVSDKGNGGNNKNDFNSGGKKIMYIPIELLPMEHKFVEEVDKVKKNKNDNISDKSETVSIDKKENFRYRNSDNNVKVNDDYSDDDYSDDDDDDDDDNDDYYYYGDDVVGLFEDDDVIVEQERYTEMEDFMIGDEIKKCWKAMVEDWNKRFANVYGIKDDNVWR